MLNLQLRPNTARYTSVLWILFALVGALSQATYSMSAKVLLQKVSPYTLAGVSFLSASLGLLCISVLWGIPPLGSGFFQAVAVTVSINIVATILFYRALSSTDLSLCVPMLAFTPVFLIITSFLILGELPTIAGAAGILMVAAGAYLLNLEYNNRRPVSLSSPFSRLFSDRGVQSMLLVSFLYSISVNFDKQVVENSNPVFGSVIVFFLLGSVFLIIAIGTGGRSGLFPQDDCSGEPAESHVPDTADLTRNSRDRTLETEFSTTIRRGRRSTGSSRRFPCSIPSWLACPAVGAILIFESVSINIAYTMTIVPYVITIKRLAIFFSVLYGGLLLHERQLGGRILGAVVMIAGAAMIALFG
jgi:drug/metabolite transporter (DMT)-like permease